MNCMGGAAKATAAAVLIGLGIGASPPAAAALAPDQVGVFPAWSLTGTSGDYTATPTFPVSASFPAVTLHSDATNVTGPSGITGFLGASTDFGAEFGSSRSQPYLNIGLAASQAPSTTTISFTGPQPDGWGFALGDVDADWVYVRAWADPLRTVPLTIDQLGFESVGNYCGNTPKPGTCAAGPYTDAPVWVTSDEDFDGTHYVPATLRGNSLPGAPAATRDTSGAYGWFRPTTDIAVMELLFGPRDGTPVFQLWFASPAPRATLTGTVSVPGASTVPPGTVAELDNADGSPVLDLEDHPLSVPVAADGTFAFDTEQRPASDPYRIEIVPPEGFEAPAPVEVVADVASPAAVLIQMEPVAEALAATGVNVGAAGGIATLALGMLLVMMTRRRRIRSA
jgi:hypothetical protein